MSRRRSLTVLMTLGILTALNGFVLGPLWLFGGGETFSDTAGSWPFATSQRLAWVLLTLTVVVVPAVLEGGSRRTPPGWAAPVVQVALAAQAATAFAMGFVAPWLAGIDPVLLDTDSGGTFFVAMTSVWVAFILAMVAFVVALARTGGVGRAPVAMLALGAVATPGVGPLGAGLIGLGLALAARRRLATAEVDTAAPAGARRSGSDRVEASLA